MQLVWSYHILIHEVNFKWKYFLKQNFFFRKMRLRDGSVLSRSLVILKVIRCLSRNAFSHSIPAFHINEKGIPTMNHIPFRSATNNVYESKKRYRGSKKWIKWGYKKAFIGWQLIDLGVFVSIVSVPRKTCRIRTRFYRHFKRGVENLPRLQQDSIKHTERDAIWRNRKTQQLTEFCLRFP